MNEKTHTITTVTPLFDEDGTFYACKVRARSNKNEKYGQSRTYSAKELKAKFKIEKADDCKAVLLNKPCYIKYELEF